MITELERADFHKLEPLLDESVLGIEARAVVQDSNPGWIFVDSGECPRSALVWSRGIEGFYLLGDPENFFFVDSLDCYVEQSIRPRARTLGLDWFEASGCSEGWDPAIERAFKNREWNRSVQYIYRPPASWTNDPGENDPAIHRIDGHLFSQTDLTRLDFLRSKIDLFWDSPGEFFAKGIGFCVVRENRIASVCMSGFVAKEVYVIDIETVEEYRRCGLGYSAGKAFIDYCSENHLVPHWDCMQTNTASASLAEKLGLTRVSEYSLYEFSFEK